MFLQSLCVFSTALVTSTRSVVETTDEVNALEDMFDVGNGILIPLHEQIRVISPRTFVLEPAFDRDEEIMIALMLLEELISKIQVCIVHCFDGREFWRQMWRDIMSIIEAIRILRISLAGAATGPEFYLRYLDRLEARFARAIKFSKIIFPVITHSPCGRFTGLTPAEIALKGTILTRSLQDGGRQSFAMHLNLGDNGIEVWLDDYAGITKTNPMAGLILDKVMSLRGIMPTDSGLSYLPDLLLIKTTVSMGWPPPVSDNSLILCEVNPGETRKAIVTARKLRGGPVPVDPVGFYFNSA